jgi:hypothetical protein
LGGVLRHSRPLVTATVVGSLLLGGCSGLGNAESGNARAAAQEFVQAARADPGAACDLLAPRTLQELEDAEGPCEQALPQQGVGSPSDPVTVEVYGKDAIVHLGDATVFLARFAEGWRVTAAACSPVPDRPYDCSVEGS